MNDRPIVYVPAWRVHESGLIVPSSVADQARPFLPELPADLMPTPAPVAIRHHVPSSADMAKAVATEEFVGLEPSSGEDLERMIAGVPFEPAFLSIARIAAEVWHTIREPERQLEIVRTFGIDELTAASEQFLVRGGAFLFSEQYLTVLQRFLIEGARDAVATEGLTEEEDLTLIRSLFATGTVVSEFDAYLMAYDPSGDEWLVYLMQNGAFNARSSTMNALVRAHALFVEQHAQLSGSSQRCDLDTWFVEDHGLSLDQQHAAGFALYGLSGAIDDDAEPRERSLVNPPFDTGPLVDHAKEIEEALTADRAWYADQFNAALAEAGGDEASIAWERRPFLRRPFLRMADGRWLLVSPRAIDSWLGEGFFFRALTAAQERNESLRFTRYFGELIEAYALALLSSVYPSPRPAGSGLVHGELPYGRDGERRTSDVIVDLGPDLVVIEVVSARLTNEMKIVGNPRLLMQNLERMLFKKMNQLGRVTTAILNGEATIPDLEVGSIERVWPVVVSAGDLMHTESLWARIEEKTPDDLRQARVESLTVLDIEDLEYLCAIVESGEHLPDLLAQRAAGPYKQLEFVRWAQEEHGVPFNLRPAFIEERWEQLTTRMKETLGFDPAEEEPEAAS